MCESQKVTAWWTLRKGRQFRGLVGIIYYSDNYFYLSFLFSWVVFVFFFFYSDARGHFFLGCLCHRVLRTPCVHTIFTCLHTQPIVPETCTLNRCCHCPPFFCPKYRLLWNWKAALSTERGGRCVSDLIPLVSMPAQRTFQMALVDVLGFVAAYFASQFQTCTGLGLVSSSIQTKTRELH